MRVFVRGGALLAGALLVAAPASAGKKECASAYVEAQKLMKGGSLRAARAQLVVCARDECLAAVKKDCVTWLDEVNSGIPTVVLKVQGPDGRDTMDVRVSVDGEVVADKLDVKAIELEPGTRKFRFEMAGRPPVEREVILRQGEKNKIVDASFAEKESPATSPSESSSNRTVMSAERPGPKTLTYVFGGVALVALAGASVFWVSSESGVSTLEDSRCAPACSGDDVSAIKRDRMIGDVLLGVSIVSAAVAVYFLLTPPPRTSKSAVLPTFGRF